MYELDLTVSHAPGQGDMDARRITAASLLDETVASRPDAEASDKLGWLTR